MSVTPLSAKLIMILSPKGENLGAKVIPGNDPNNSSSEDISALCAGTYAVTISDANGCIQTENITINQPSPLSLSASSINSNCGNSDGQVSVQVIGGTPNYSL